MGTLVAIAYPDVATAEKVRGESRAGDQGAPDPARGRGHRRAPRRRQDEAAPGESTTGAGAAGGALWGGIIGLLFLAPLFGMAIGAATGAGPAR